MAIFQRIFNANGFSDKISLQSNSQTVVKIHWKEKVRKLQIVPTNPIAIHNSATHKPFQTNMAQSLRHQRSILQPTHSQCIEARQQRHIFSLAYRTEYEDNNSDDKDGFNYRVFFSSVVPPLKVKKKLIQARLGVSRPIYVNGFPYFNFLGGYQLKKHPV